MHFYSSIFLKNEVLGSYFKNQFFIIQFKDKLYYFHYGKIIQKITIHGHNVTIFLRQGHNVT